MAENKLVVSLALKAGGYKTEIKAINRETKLLKSEFEAAKGANKEFEKSFEGQKAKIKAVGGELANTQKKLEIYKREVTNTEKVLSEATKAFQEQEKEIQSLKLQINEYSNAYGNSSKAVKALEQELQKAEKALEAKRRAVVNADTSLTNLQTNVNKTETEISKLSREVEDLNKELSKNKNWETYGKKLTDVSGKITKAGKGISSAGTKISVAGAGITAAFTGATKTSINFESAMSKVQSTSSATAEEIDQLSKEAERLGKEIKGASMVEIAQSYDYLALAGYKTNQMLQVMEPTIKANIAFGGDMATTADLMTDSLSALGKGAEEAEHYLNVVAQTSRNANTSGTQLMEAYIEAGSTLNKLNIPLEESAKILAVMADNGLKGSEAGRALQSVLVNLMGTTSTTAGALKELGVETYDSNDKFRGLETVLNDVVTSASRMTDEQADMILAMLGGKTQLTALNNMLKATDEKYINLENSIKNSDGALEEMYKTMSDNTQGTWQETQSKIEAMAKSFGDMLLPIVNDVIKVIGNFADWLSSLNEGTRKVILGVSAFIVALGPALIILGQLIISVGAITGALGALSTAIGSAGSLMAFFTTSILPVITTIGTVIGVVVALAMAIKENWEGIKSATQSLIDKCEPAFEGLKNAFSTLWDTCMDIYNTVIQPLFKMIGEVIEVCIQFATPFLILLMDQFSNVMNLISVAWAVVGKPVFSAIMAIIQTVWAIVKPILSAIADLFSSIMSIISATWNSIGAPVFNGIINVVKSISNVVGPAFETFKNVITSAMKAVLSPIQWVIDKLKSLTDWIKGIGDKVGGFVSGIGNLFGGKARNIDVDVQAQDLEPVALSGSYYNADTRKALDFRNNLDSVTVGSSAYSSKKNELLNVDELVNKLTEGISTALLGALSGIQLETNLNLDSKPIGRAIAPLIDTEIAKIQRRRF